MNLIGGEGEYTVWYLDDMVCVCVCVFYVDMEVRFDTGYVVIEFVQKR